MSAFIQQAADFPTQGIDWLADLQASASQIWLAQAMPSRKTENWKYTNLKHIETSGFYTSRCSSTATTSTLQDIKGLNGPKLVFVDGGYSEALSSGLVDLEEGLEVVRFSEANEAQQNAILANLGKIQHKSKDADHPFAALNASKFEDGVFVLVKRNTVVDKPIEIVSVTSDGQDAQTINLRNLVILETGSRATVIERFQSHGDQLVLANGVTEIHVQENAHLFHYRLHKEHESAAHIGGVHCLLERHSTLDSFQLALGSRMTRVDVVVHHNGEGAHCELNGVYLPRNNQHVDFHTTIEHAVPHCTTNEVFRGIISDSARAVFNGRIHIHPDAQKTLAQLSNKNLLTSNKAEIDTKPELEIYADDVQCAHGATVAQLEDESVHYLRTRGVSEKDARVMLSFGFINELINNIKHEVIADFIRPSLAELFAKESNLLESLG